MKKITFIIAVLSLAVSLSACNTIQGIGDDIAGIGKGLSGASEKVKDDLTRER